MNNSFVPTHKAPPTPGEILKQEFLIPLRISAVEFAKNYGIPVDKIILIVYGMIEIDDEMAQTIANSTGTTKQLWLNFQNSTNEFKKNSQKLLDNP